MVVNQKLTRVIGGRVVTSVERVDEADVVRFADGSRMIVKTAAPAAHADARGAVERVRQQGTTLGVELAGGATIEFTTAEPMASVIVRASDETMEYAD